MAGASLDGVDSLNSSIKAIQGRWFSGTARGTVQSDVEYAFYVEYGTRHMAAQPYMRPAVEAASRRVEQVAHRADSNDELAALLAEEIEAEAKRLVPVDTGKLKASIKVTVTAGGGSATASVST